MAMTMIDVKNMSKSYGPVRALKDVSFQIEEGEIIGLLGPNGAGKTTMIKILTGYLQPDEGQVHVDGLDVLTDTLAVQERIGYLPENAPLYPELTVQSYLMMIAELRQIPEQERLDALAQAVESTALGNHLTRPIRELSKGYRQRVGLAQAILHQPRLLILDEPTVGLDPTQIVHVRNLVRRLAKNSTVLLSTHILSEVEAICDRVIILMNGEIKADARLADLATTSDVLLVLAKGADGSQKGDDLKALSDVQSVEAERVPDGWQYRVRCAPGADVRPAIYDLARENAWPLRELRRDVRTLEAIFNELAVSAANEKTTQDGQD
jgi:ABC-2 type transport system ATP-binding protein